MSELTPDQLRELKDRLTGKQQELADRIKTLGEVTGTRKDCAILDMGDSATLNEMRVRAAALIDQAGATLSEIEAALTRLKEGRYGNDENTGEPLSYQRLLAIPWARTAPGD